MRKWLLGLLLTVCASSGARAGSLDPVDSLPKPALAKIENQRFLPMHRRMDRGINSVKYVHKGEVAMGLTVSYGTLSSEDTDLYLILDNIDLKGNTFSIKPSVGYFFRDNLGVGLRLGYSKMHGELGNISPFLGEIMDLDISLGDVWYDSQAINIGAYLRSYAGLDAKGTFAVFGELDLSVKTGKSRFAYRSGDNINATNNRETRLSLGFNPGVSVFIMPNVCTTMSVGLGGLEYAMIRQADDEGNFIGRRIQSKMRFRVNLLNINIGVTMHLFNSKHPAQ